MTYDAKLITFHFIDVYFSGNNHLVKSGTEISSN